MAEHDMLVLGRAHIVAQRVRRSAACHSFAVVAGRSPEAVQARHLGDKIEAYAMLHSAEVSADGWASGSAPYHRTSVGGRGHILVP
jgi:hypothetical protein